MRGSRLTSAPVNPRPFLLFGRPAPAPGPPDDLAVLLGSRYEWWLMKEAKARNPDLKLYGLSWAVPGWIGNGSYFAGDDNINYHINWIEGAKRVHNLTIDYVG